MSRCPHCSNEAPEGSRFCPSCAAPLSASSTPTRTSIESQEPTKALASSHPSLDQSRFTPGDLLAKRYRIISLLGRGGMGEVYRADDLKLGQRVALKFLPAAKLEARSKHASIVSSTRSSIARQVSHPNVCRVYDVAERSTATSFPFHGIRGRRRSRVACCVKDRAPAPAEGASDWPGRSAPAWPPHTSRASCTAT